MMVNFITTRVTIILCYSWLKNALDLVRTGTHDSFHLSHVTHTLPVITFATQVYDIVRQNWVHVNMHILVVFDHERPLTSFLWFLLYTCLWLHVG